ncbi:Tuberous sclerosis 2-like protein [Tulasnella sp. 419]|nr:Tuberous sclerosis 2-like protein [Tulasnella sp. 419]
MSPLSNSSGGQDRDRDGPRQPTRFPSFNFNRILGGHRQSNASTTPNPPKATPGLAPTTATTATTATTVTATPKATTTTTTTSVSTQLSLDTILERLTQWQNMSSSELIEYARKASDLLVSPDTPSPHPHSITPPLLRLCSSSAPTDVRVSGFHLMATYLTTATSPLSSIDKSAFWGIIKNSPASIFDADPRTRSLWLLTAQAREIDGISQLIPTLVEWSRHFSSQRIEFYADPATKSASDTWLAWCLTFLTKVLKDNAPSLSSTDVSTILLTFDDLVNDALVASEPGKSSPNILGQGLVTSPSPSTPSIHPLAAAMSRSPSSSTPSLHSQSQHHLLQHQRPTPTTTRTSTSSSHLPLLSTSAHRRHPSSTASLSAAAHGVPSPVEHQSPSHTSHVDLLSTISASSTAGPSTNLSTSEIRNTLHLLPTLLYISLLSQILSSSFTLIPSTTCLPSVVRTLCIAVSRSLEVLPVLSIHTPTPALATIGLPTSASSTSLSAGLSLVPILPPPAPALPQSSPTPHQGHVIDLNADEGGMSEIVTGITTTAAGAGPNGTKSEVHVERMCWEIARLLLSGPYATLTTRILKKVLVDHHTAIKSENDTTCSVLYRARAAEGSARLMRLALRKAAEGRLARSWLSNQVCVSYNPSGAPSFSVGNGSEQGGEDIMQRAWGKEGEGGAWEFERVKRCMPECVEVWVSRMQDGDEDGWMKEKVVRECLGIVDDILEEAILIADDSRNSNMMNGGFSGSYGSPMGNIGGTAVGLGVIEGHVVGDVLTRALEALKRPGYRNSYVLNLSPGTSIPPTAQPTTPLINTLTKVCSRFSLSPRQSQAPTFTVDAQQSPASSQDAKPSLLTSLVSSTAITPSFPSILIEVGESLSDETLADVVRWYAGEGLLIPSTPTWLDNLQQLFKAVASGWLTLPTSDTSPVSSPLTPLPVSQQPPAITLSSPMKTSRFLSRKALSQVTLVVYQGVRDHRPYRISLLKTCLNWEPVFVGTGGKDDKGMQPGGEEWWGLMEDGIVAGAAEGTLPTSDNPGEGDGALEVKLRTLVCKMARDCRCPLEVDPERDEETEEVRDSRSTSVTPASRAVSASGSTSGQSNTLMTMLSNALTSPAAPNNTATPQSVPPTRTTSNAAVNPTAPPPSAQPSSVLATPHQPTHPELVQQLLTRHEISCRSLAAVLTLIRAFRTLAFSPPHSLSTTSKMARAPASLECIHVFRDLLALITPDAVQPLSEEEASWNERYRPGESPTGVGQAKCSRARLAILQWLMRLRADRDHRLYVVKDIDVEVVNLAKLIGRTAGDTVAETVPNLVANEEEEEVKERERGVRRNTSVTRKGFGGVEIAGSNSPNSKKDPFAGEVRRSRAFSRGRREDVSRSRSQPPRSSTVPAKTLVLTAREPIWGVPESLPFDVPIGTRPSEGMTTYEAGMSQAGGLTPKLWLPVSAYLCSILDILKYERDWEILSYVLCHLPNQLSNKHLFCGPMTSKVIVHLTGTLCSLINSNKLGAGDDAGLSLPNNLKTGDVQGVGYHSLTVLISYRRLFTRPLFDALVEAFLLGLSRSSATIKPCLHALTLAAFELQPQMTRSLSRLVNQLSQIITNPAVSGHILELLIILGSVPALYTNFTVEDYKRVFTVALKYIQHHNQPSVTSSVKIPQGSFALNQHVLTMAYYTIYIWFLAVKVSDRPKHIPYIVRMLLLAHEHKGEVDEPTEVCLDWLARYSYGDADPKPSRTFLGDIIAPEGSGDAVITGKKCWIQGNSILIIKSLKRPGWLEVEVRRPSGMTRMYCRLDNVALLGLHVNLDADNPKIADQTDSSAVGTPRPTNHISLDDSAASSETNSEYQNPSTVDLNQEPSTAPAPQSENSLTGSAWAGATPPNKPTDITVDPSYLFMLLAPYPDFRPPLTRPRLIPDDDVFQRLLRNIDRVPVIDCHTIGIMYVAPGQTTEVEILGNRHGSPAYTRFLHGIGRLITLKNQKQVYTGQLDTYNDDDGKYAYAWWDDIAQILYHASTMMPNRPGDNQHAFKKRHIGNDYVRIVWNDSGLPYKFDTLKTQFQFVNIVIEPHSIGTIGAYSNSLHEHEFFKVTCQRAEGMAEFGPIGEFKLIAAENLPLFVRKVSLFADFFALVYKFTANDTKKAEYVTNWRHRLQMIKRHQEKLTPIVQDEGGHGIMSQESARDFTRTY